MSSNAAAVAPEAVKAPRGRKKQEKDVRTAWKVIAPQTIQSTIRDFVHFSNKVTNSNTLPGGVRLAPSQRLDLPVVAAQTIGANHLPLDYIGNSGQTATIAKQLEAVEQGTVNDLFTDVPADNLKIYVAALAAVRDTAAEVKQVGIGKRLRQIIVQDADGNDVVLTPLGCAGLGALLNQRLAEERERLTGDDQVYRKRALLELGGANPQNVGRHIRSLQRPLWFNAPTQDNAVRAAFSYHYKGISLEAPMQVLMEYDAFLIDRKMQKNGIRNNEENRALEVGYIERIAASIVKRAEYAFQTCARVRDDLPNAEITSESLPAPMRALIDPDCRYSGWKRQAAMSIQLVILEQKMPLPTGPRSLRIDQEAATRWITVIEGAL